MSIVDGFAFYCLHRQLGPKFWRLRLVCKDVERAIQRNTIMWREWCFGSSVPRDPPLAIVCTKQVDNHLTVMLEIPNRKLIGDLFIYALRRTKYNEMKNIIKTYQRELKRRWLHVKSGFTDIATAECKELVNLIECFRQKQLEYGIFID